MKKLLRFTKVALTAMATMLLVQGCLKDTCTRTFTMFTPVYKTSAEVRANIKNNPAEPIRAAGKMFVQGNYIFLNEIDKGVHIIDNTNPLNPVNKYFINIPGNIDVAVKGNTLYADLYSDMVAIDISNPAAIVLKKVVDDVFPFRRYINGFVSDTSKVIVSWITKDTVVNCSAGWYPQTGMLYMDAAALQSSSPSPAKGISGSMARFTLMNDYLYTVTDHQLNVFDIVQANDPVLKNTVGIAGGIETIYPFKDKLFIGSATGMFIYGTTNPTAPERLSMFAHARVCDPVIAEDDYAYVTLRSGSVCGGFQNQLDVLNIMNITNPTLVKSYNLTNPHGLSKTGDLLFICDGPDGLKVFDAASVTDIKLKKTFGGFDAYDVITYNNLAIVSAKDGLYQFNIQDVNNIKQISKINIVKN